MAKNSLRSQPEPPSPERQLSALEQKWRSWLFSNRQMVVCHLRANPNPQKQEEIIADYLQSPELLRDPSTLGEFFAFWLLEFFQKADTGPIESLGNFIKNSANKPLPPELHNARRVIFEPLFAILNGKEKKFFKNAKELGLFGVGRNLAQSLLESNQSLPESLISQYQQFVRQLVKIEAGIEKVGPAQPEPTEPKNKKEKPTPPNSLPKKETSPATPQITETGGKFSFVIVLGANSESGQNEIETLEQLQEVMEKISSLGPVTPQTVWDKLQELQKMTPQQIIERYKERVAGGPFKGWYEIRMGRKWLIIFEINGNQIFFRVGSHENVYATRRRKPPDRARSL